MRTKGRPILGGIAGFFFFLFLAVDLLAFGVVPLNSPVLTLLPVLGIALGIAWAYWAPLRRGGAPQAPPPATF